MDEKIDGRTLVGSYVCTEQPGEFRWQPGPLTQAVINGFWVVFENIDQAASDVQSILLPLLEGGSTFLTGYGEGIRVAEGFRLFSTISTSKVDICYHTEGKNSLSALWRRVMVRPAACVDLANIVTAWYPDLEPVAGTIIETFEKLNRVSELPGSGSKNSSSRFSLRDLLKWCRRIAGLDFSFRADGLSVDLRSSIYLEAVDVFAVNTASPGSRLNIARNIANMWAVPAREAEALYCLNRPVLEDLPGVVHIGRVSLQKNEEAVCVEKKPFVEIRSSFLVLERIACAVKWNEAVLLVGETGTGKTTLVQNLAARLGQKLTVLNLSQQSDVADLLGGFKPMDPQYICVPLYMEFESLFSSSFSTKIKDNEDFLVCLKKLVNDKNWSKLIRGFQKGIQKVDGLGRCEPGTKRKRPLNERLLGHWKIFSHKVKIAHKQLAASSGMVFSFVEGAFVTALRNGEWILLDEVNLAPPETLQRIIGVLDGENGSLCLAESGVVVDRHPHFRLFACMNPATDAGKRELPYSLRSRFTECFVDDVLEDEDLTLFVNQFLDDKHTDKDLVNKIVRFYKAAKKESEEKLLDGANQKPQYSLRSLYRALEYIRKARELGFRRALYDGFCMFFMTLLEDHSAELMNEMIVSYLLGGHKQLPPPLHLEQLLHIRERPESEQFLREYIITKSVEERILSLARAVYIKRYPVLLQGPTSSGKTSLVQYLAAKTGHEFVRINNHEHTDLQEYLGSYITDACGRLAFHEGVLVKAVRYGHWIVLDELNLAPSDVLEALNRLLDDNRELFVPELHETVRAHPNFMLFATQNPPTFYGGRKMLSRAFRNRFVEIHVDDIPEDELTDILKNKCEVPRSYAKKMIEVMKELQLRRQKSKVFAGKHGFITPRDLFRWANRFRKFGTSYEDLARDCYFLLAERLRDEIEKNVVQEVLEKHLRVKLKTDELYKQGYEANFFQDNVGNIVWTKSMQRMYFLIERCYQLKEPVLLIGETGGGKTTVCQLLSMALNSKLHILNCHQYTETSDFIGGFYPVRERSRYASDFKILIEQLVLSKAFIHFQNDINLSTDIGKAPSTLKQLEEIVNWCKDGLVAPSEVNESDLASLVKLKAELSQLYQQWQTIFVWQDGPLVHAMKNGDLFLVDEISLADDSVLERLNSVLEPDRKLISKLANRYFSVCHAVLEYDNLSLAEKGGPNLETVTAHDDFFILATMNPGGDYGKKELSPALRNRFTEIWVPPIVDLDELRGIAKRFLSPELHRFVNPLSNFWEWFNELQAGRTLTVRDLLAWLDFVTKSVQSLHPNFAFLHGAFLVLLDGLSLGTGISKNEVAEVRERCLAFLVKLLKADDIDVAGTELLRMENYGWADADSVVDTSEPEGMQCDNLFGIHPFYIEKGGALLEDCGFEFLAPTTRRNVLRVLRAMQLSKPVLLEGSPGVGKTSLISAIGKFSGHKVVRINLSEQTDIMDLLGSDLPIESDEGVQFAWSDGILLQVYVDELGEHDYHSICRSRFPSVPDSMLTCLIAFNKRLYEETMVYNKFAQHGSPWEFNLRDIIRSCQIIEGSSGNNKTSCFLNAVYVQRMRTAADRREVLRLYEEVFGMSPSINPYPRVQMDDHFLVVGDTRIKRNRFQTVKSIGSELKIFPGLRNTLEAAAQCIQQKWLCILVGATSSGKTSLIRLLAQLSGNVLHEINLSSASDISELLGSFEQYDAYRNFHSIVTQVERYINEYCNLQLDLSADNFFRERKDLITKWLYFSSNISFGNMSKSDAADGQIWRESLSVLAEIIELLAMDLKRYTLSVSWSLDDLSIVLQRVQKLQEIQKGKSVLVKFEWAAGLLIKAIENGEWIVLEDANLCNPTVLDRINSLVESEGSITVNECGNVDGKPLVLSPHPNFRMFLTVNPSHGDVSRAMRNRGIEIVMMHPYWLHNEDEKAKIQEIELDDIKSFLALSNIPHGMLVDSMAKAHMHARNKGLCLDVHITYLELGRWVQLFEQLLMTGNDALWSLHRSWEHSYLSSLGEPEGWQIVQEAKAAYLTRIGSLYHGGKLVVSEDACSKQVTDASNGDLSLCLPGGWPAPLKLRDFVWYSIEASVRQNCMYMEYLGVQCASFELYVPRQQLLRESVCTNNSQSIYLMDLKMLQQMMYPQSSNEKIISYTKTKEHDMLLIKKKLSFAADWVIDQVFGKSDLELCLLWFSWFDLQLAPWCHFFQSLGNLLRKELGHPIWKCIFRIHDELSHSNVDVNQQSLPILALESVDLIARLSTPSSKQLSNAINSVGLLRRSLWQWNAETNEEVTDKSVEKLLNTLRKLEEEVLDVIVESTSFDLLHQTYADLLEEHTLFWKVVVSSEFETLLVHWRALLKNVFKLREHFPEAVKNLLEGRGLERSFDMASINLNRRLPFSLKSEKSLLWAHGGHPSLPSSADINNELQQLLGFAKLVWPRKHLQKKVDRCVVEIAASTNTKLRSLAMQGVCMTSSFFMKYEEGNVVENLQEMHKMLSMRFESERNKLEAKSRSQTSGYALESSACCTLIPEILNFRCGLETWVESLPIIDETSLLLDLFLLQDLSSIILADTRDLQLLDVNLLVLFWNFGLNGIPHCGIVPSSLTRQNAFVMKDYQFHCFKLRVVSSNIWRCIVPNGNVNLHSSLLRAARYMLLQIISAHRKSFTAENFMAIKSCLLSLQRNEFKQDDTEALLSLLGSSRHQKFVSLVEPLIKPLLKTVADICSFEDSQYHLSCAWLTLGGLRFHLLLACDELDPAIKYSSKHQKLVDKCKSLKLENEVICRSDPGKFIKLKDECIAFSEHVNSGLKLLEESNHITSLSSLTYKTRSWQATASHFIDRLSEEYDSYLDIIQPIQVAVYEMKLGMALLLSSGLQRDYLVRVQETKVDPILATTFRLEASLLDNILGHVVKLVSNTKLLDDASFTIVDEIFHIFTRLWRDVKVQEKTEKDIEAQMYKFRPRPFKLDNAYEIDLSSLSSSFSGDSFTEWKESLCDEESAQGKDVIDLPESSGNWNLIPEPMLNSMVNMHNQLFGSNNLVETDPNPAVVASMVELLNALREQVSSLSKERDEHAGLQKILNICDMLLGLPSSTTVAQALSGLQFLVSQVRLLLENGAKFPLTDKLEPIVALISCFQKREFDMWKTMLDDVLTQFEMNAAKLWFPLYLVLHRESTTDIVEYTQSTLQRRLQLILSFYGQLNAGIDLKSYSRVMNHIATSTKNISKELEELLKLCHWDRPEKLMYVENSKRNRQKLKKLIQKYTDALQQPVMLVLSREPGQIGLKSQKLDYSPVKDQESSASDISQFIDRTSWFDDWKRKIDNAVQGLHSGRKVDKHASLLFSEVGASTIRPHSILKSPDLAYKEYWIEENFKKGQSNWWFYLPSYDAKHLLLKHDANVSGLFKSSNSTDIEERWRCANQYYFKSLASVRHLQQISLNFDKDFNPDQVNQCNSFLEHLVMIQMEQRAAAYYMSEKLQHLRRSLGCLKKLNLDCHPYTEGNTNKVDVSNSQYFMFKIMWQQKELFDTFCSVLDEESLMLQIVGSIHLDGCYNIKNAANEISLLIEKFSSLFIKSKARLDDELLGGGDSAIKSTASLHLVVVSKDMELLVIQNFQLIRELKDHVLALHGQGIDKRSVKDILLDHLEELIKKAENVESEFNSSKSCNKPLVDQEAEVGAKLDAIYRYIGISLQELGSCSNRDIFDEAFLGKISSWKLLFDSFATDLQLVLISQELDQLISYAGKLPNMCGLSSNTGMRFKRLEELLALILTFSDGLLRDFLAVHELVSILTHRLAEIFASLFSEGYGVRTEDQADDTQGDKTQDASGTGMGEGAGVKDVSNQITDEDQLLGTSGEKEEPNTMNELPSKNDEGIEMQENFEASEYSVSEDSGNEDNDDENEDDEVGQLDRAMGDTGDDGEVADEKLWDKEEDQNLDTKTEKYDAGPSVKDKDPNNRELKAKDDSAATTDEQTEGNSDKSGENEDMDTGKDNVEDNEIDSMNNDQEDIHADSTDIDINEPDQTSAQDSENMEVDPGNVMEEDETDKMDHDMDKADSEDNTAVSEDETSLKSESIHLGEGAENDDSENKNEGDDHMDLTAPTNDNSEQGNSDLLTDHIPNTQSMTEMQNAYSRSTAPQSSSGFQNDLASSENPSQVEMLSGNSSKGNLSNDQPESNSPQHDLSSLQKNHPNPLRNIGDALEEWKEQVKVSADIPQRDEETVDDTDGEEADQFGFTSEFDQGTAQALGSAMPDQVEHNIGHDKPDVDGFAAEENKLKELHDEDSNSEAVPSHPVSKRKVDEKINNFNSLDESPVEDTQEYKRKDNISPERPSENFVSVKKSYTTVDMNQLSEIFANGDEPGKVQNLAQQLNEMQMNASALWRKYELRTMRLSQELAEKLRLVMEPTLASKLQGDYRTGKRINMKKVIPYIASHYRKDKIWLRRTKPNKRDYQVVIVVDDSRSMSENCCGDFAIEALVTVCRALSQLEVGKLAVTSFGKEGNIKLLHDFDQPLTGEAGMKMISSLTFNQENTLREEPMVELLKYLNNMLEHAVANARLPSGQNPLQQLVLIIADGRFHDNKEKVKRLTRDVLQRNCMVAFIVLDGAQESIVDCKDYIFKNGLLQKAVPYLDSFPFPYYMVLRNIEALPRTLADLLRQWLELMQQSRD
ncbi:Midasin [Bienertia sinuspersici]